MEKKEVTTKKSSSSKIGIAIAVAGIILIIAAGAYAIYKRYIIGHTSFSHLAFNSTVDALGIIGVILLIVGIVLYYRMKTPKSSVTTTTTGTPDTDGSGQN